MPTGSQHKSAELVRALYIGNSGAGKTGSLVSLIAAGYKLRVVDLDQGLDILVNLIKEQCPDKIDNLGYQSFRNKTKITNTGPQVVGSPTAFTNSVKALDKWEDDTDPSEWGPEYILVLDTLTSLGREAFLWAKAMNPTSKDPRQLYNAAQETLESILATLTSDDFNTNVIVMSHIDIRELNGLTKGFASSIGKALGPKIPRYFNTTIMAETSGAGKNIKRTIKTVSTALVDLKVSAPMRIDAEYPLETGMATLFEKLKSA